MHSFFTKEVSGVSRFPIPRSLQTHASAFPTGILASTLTGETELLPLSKVADKLGCPSRRIDFAISRHSPGFARAITGFFSLKAVPSGTFNTTFIAIRAKIRITLMDMRNVLFNFINVKYPYIISIYIFIITYVENIIIETVWSMKTTVKLSLHLLFLIFHIFSYNLSRILIRGNHTERTYWKWLSNIANWKISKSSLFLHGICKFVSYNYLIAYSITGWYK